MASDAEAILSHPRPADSQRLTTTVDRLRTSVPFALLWLGAFVYAAIVVAELHLFDNDYDWINQAQDTGWIQIVAEILRPVPEQWGFQDRPIQVLCFKLLHGLFGYSAAGFYTFKAMLFATVSLGLAQIATCFGLGRNVGLLAGAIFALASPGHASALWVSDFEMLAEILIIAALGVFWRIANTIPRSKRNELLHQALFVLLAVIAHRTKGSAKLIPAIVVIYLFLYKREQIRRFAPSLALISLTIVPVIHLLTDPLPPFAPFATDQSQGWMWKPANLETMSLLVAGNLHLLRGTAGPNIAYSLLSVVTPALLWPALFALAYLAVRKRKFFLDPVLGFVVIWLSVSIIAYASFPQLPEGFMARYVVVALVPASILIAWSIHAAAGRLTRRVWVTAMTALLAFHAVHNFDSTKGLRNTLGQVIVAHDRAREHITRNIVGSDVLIVGFDYGYNRRIVDSNRYHRKLRVMVDNQTRPLHALVRTDQDLTRLDHRAPIQDLKQALQMPNAPGLKVQVRPIKVFSGLTESFYDKRFYRNNRAFAGILYEITYGQKDS